MTPHPMNTAVAAVIPAYNEAPTIADAVREIRAAGACDEVIVVDDGSSDKTAELAEAAGATVIRLGGNSGKGAALAAGVAATDAPVLLFSDADVLGLKPEYVRALVEPVRDGRSPMVVGIRARHRIVDSFTQRALPKLSGMRALRREVFLALQPQDLARFRVETALNYAAKRFGAPLTTMLRGLTHFTKEEKRGLVMGLIARLRMIGNIMHAHLSLRAGQLAKEFGAVKA